MLGSPPAATATLHTSTSSATPSSPSRPSRLRGLSYLRSYTHNHLSSHHPTTSTSPKQERSHLSTERPTLSRTTTSPVPDTPRSPRSPTRRESEAQTPTTTAAERLGQAENGQWVPTVQGRSGLRRESANPTSESRENVSAESSERLEPGSAAAGMTKTRQNEPTAADREGLAGSVDATNAAATLPAAPEASSSANGTTHVSGKGEQLPTIRFIPHLEPRSARPSLHFSTLSRTLKTAHSVVKVGRYSEKDSNPRATPESETAPVGFKSKVVSRRHCEFWCTNGQWYVKDVKSSSGTFLNHVRLSAPGQESRPYPVNDGDVVQLGIDFKGGEEVIFRCVKIRVECNRGWQKALNNFNTSTHKKLLRQHLAKPSNRDSDAMSVNTSECSICLNPVAPCQALFVAPCSHVWHYKCVRNLIHSVNYPNFLCPNCRFVADLEADVEPPEEEYDDAELQAILEQSKTAESAQQNGAVERRRSSAANSRENNEPSGSAQPGDGTPSAINDTSEHESTRERITGPDLTDEDLAHLMNTASLNNSTRNTSATPSIHRDSPVEPPSTGATITGPSSSTLTSSSATRPVNIKSPTSFSHHRTASNDLLGARSMTPTTHNIFSLSAAERMADSGHSDTDRSDHMPEGPMTPRNDVGPFVFDGSGSGRLHDEDVPDTVPEEDESSRRPSRHAIGQSEEM